MRTLPVLGAVATATALVMTLTGPAAASAERPPSLRVAPADGALRATWTSPEPAGRLTAFEVRHRTRRAGSWTGWDSRTLPASRQALRVRGRNGSVHQLRVRAVYRRADGPYSRRATVRVGTPGRPSARVAVAGRRLTVRWTRPAQNGAPVSGYTVRLRHRHDDGSWAGWRKRSVGPARRTVTWHGLQEGARYQVAVAARNRYGPGPAVRAGRRIPLPLPDLVPAPPVAAEPAPAPPTPTPSTPPTSPPAPPPAPPVRTAFRVYVAVPSDATTTVTDAAIRHEITLTTDWFSAQTGGRVPRFVRDGTGAVSVTRVTLQATRAQLEATAVHPFFAVVNSFPAEHPLAATEARVVYAEVGRSTWTTCGTAGPSVHQAVLFMGACGGRYPSELTATFHTGSTVTLAHEVVHLFGAVPDCAPNSNGTGHVSDARDLMNPSYRVGDVVTLDPGRDDYYGTGRPPESGCPDISTSPMWQ